MTREEYTNTVLAQLRRVTEDERRAIRAELDGHVEDHMEALRELGCEEAEAEARALERMGDPAEVGRALNKVYTGWVWVLLSRAAILLTVVLCIQAVLGIGILSNLLWSIQARTIPQEVRSDYRAWATIEPDIRVPIGNDVLRVYRVSLVERKDGPAAQVALAAYDRIPGGVVSQRLIPSVVLADQRGAVPDRDTGGGGMGCFTAEFTLRYVPVREGDTYITLTYDWLGETAEVTIPLPETGGGS